MPVGYDVKEAAQVIAFLIREQGGSADMIKTVKLAYLADREFQTATDIRFSTTIFIALTTAPSIPSLLIT